MSFAGNLTDNPEVRYTDSGIARAMFRVAVSGRREQEASFFTVILWRDQAEHAAESLAKDSRIVVLGRLQQRSWTAEDDSAQRSAPSCRARGTGAGQQCRQRTLTLRAPTSQRNTAPGPIRSRTRLAASSQVGDGWRYGYTEPPGQQGKIVSVGRAQRVAQAMTNLQGGSLAAHRSAGDHAGRGQLLGRVGAPCVGAQILPAVAVPVEDHRVQVDLAAVGVDQDQPGRQPGHGGRVVGEAHRCQRLLPGGEIIRGDDQIQVPVRAGLAAEQGIDPPAAIQPDHHPGGFELAEDPAGIGGVDLHHRSSQPPAPARRQTPMPPAP
jgi:single-strand DNA-binding protein